MTDTLQKILSTKREHVARCKLAKPLSAVEADARAQERPRGFLMALERARREGRYGLIAEIKKASPSKGLIREDFDPPALAEAYLAGGATCLSILTDEPYFQGCNAYLKAARRTVPLPVLRKDFMIDPYQVVEARAIGADCILLIIAGLEDSQAAELEAAAESLGMDVLVEVHSAEELERATRLNSRLLGINNRNLKTMSVDINTTIELASLLPQGYLVVGESGLRTKADLDLLAARSVTTFLVGESLMAQPDVTAATRSLLGLAAE
ncbi:indole-3-glycerol phosphate synthase TrpC [Pedomonas mirosovicensis]|uniref:indole-3-glycerol phosphate synthase TrpC n=1 Tax=Pedomonas mirosovicensis TaxID=2908641 RepID=UPI0021675804|nr:indole-3-glycerol phosphate synthase TrpC [Pedomonas mirosovicensis]MCH8685390.1 indole-3-glycerol phosphate synthase TrpC [Pedomonas mirosovicensis]